MGKVISIILSLVTVLSLVFIVNADSTFFDDENDAFIMGNSPTSTTTDSGVTGGTTGGGGCRYEWNCTNWSECFLSGKQTRNCTNIGTCPTTYNVPELEQNCTYVAPKVEKEDKEGKKEKVTEEEEEVPEEQETNKNEIVNENKAFIYSIIILVVISIIFYLKKDYDKIGPV